MRVRRFSTVLTLIAAVALVAAAAAAAAPKWRAPMTVQVVRGIADPRVGIDHAGKATVVYSHAPFSAETKRPGIYATWRHSGGLFSVPSRLGNGVKPQIVVAPSGDTAIAWLDGSRIRVLRQPAPGQLGAAGQLVRTVSTGPVRDLHLVLDRTGQATVLWTPPVEDGVYPPEPAQLRAAAVSPAGEVGATQELGSPAPCWRLSVAANLVGDVVALCSGALQIHTRAPGQELFGSEPFEPAEVVDLAGNSGPSQVVLDGAGRATVYNGYGGHGQSTTFYRDRPRGGTFGARHSLPVGQFATIFAQESRTVAVWRRNRGIGFSVRAAGGDFGPLRSIPTGTPSPSQRLSGLLDVRAPLGPLPLLFDRNWRDSGTSRPPGSRPLETVTIAPSGAGSFGPPLSVSGEFDFPGNIAAAESGLALAVWEQKCDGGYVVMAMALDHRRGTSEPPCQDRRAPKVAVRPKRARLAGRAVRARIGCHEACRLGVRANVRDAGSGRLLATAGSKRAARLEPHRFRTFRLRLRGTEAARLRSALSRRQRVTVRLALSVRDGYRNAAVRRVAVPLRR